MGKTVDKYPENPDGNIPMYVKTKIFDYMKLENVSWSGSFDEQVFLSRLDYDLENLPSTDERFKNAAEDIRQHQVNNYDWEDRWVLNDSRFGLLSDGPERFLRFLCEVLHPVVRPDQDEVLKLLQYFNDQLRPCGWHLIKKEDNFGHHHYEAQDIQNNHNRFVTRARIAADALDSGWMRDEIERVENVIDTDPALVIGTAKDLLESCCKTILTERGVSLNNSDNLPKLTRALMNELRLVPDGIPDKTKGAEKIRIILSNLSSLTQHMAELRGLYGSGHGRDRKYKGLEPRHARLAFASAVAFIDFVTETYRQRIEPNNAAKIPTSG